LLFFANEGEVRRAQHDDQATQVLCLNLVTNAIIAWNTVYLAEAIDSLRANGYDVDDQDVVHLAPTLRQHINVYGKYRFDLESGRGIVASVLSARHQRLQRRLTLLRFFGYPPRRVERSRTWSAAAC
jgi:Tn3 transposase DDE domain